MPRPPSDSVQIAIRVPKPWLEEADEVAGLLSRHGLNASRTDAFRRAIEEGFAVLRAQAELDRDAGLDDAMFDVLSVIDPDPTPTAAIMKALHSKGYNPNWPHFPRVLSELVRVGFVTERANKYASTARGRVRLRTEMMVRAEADDAKASKGRK